MVSLVFSTVFKYVFYIESNEPLVSGVSSLVPTSSNIPISTVVGKEGDSVRTVIPFGSLLVSIFLSEISLDLLLNPGSDLLGSV